MEESIPAPQGELVCYPKARMDEAEPLAEILLVGVLMFGMLWGFLGAALLRRTTPRCTTPTRTMPGRQPVRPGSNRFGELDD